MGTYHVAVDRNELERLLLEMLDFNIDVDSSVYAKYYFELRELAEKYDKAFPLDPLDKNMAMKLEVWGLCIACRQCKFTPGALCLGHFKPQP